MTRDETLVFDRIEQPDAILEDLLKIYWQGQHVPLHFFQELSLDFYRLTAQKGKKPAEAIRSLRSKWEGSERRRGQLDDPYVRICVERSDPLDEAFRQLAEQVFRPLVGCMEESS